MKKPNWIVRFFSFLLKVIVVLVLMVVIAVGSFEGVSYYLTGDLYDLRKIAEKKTDITNINTNNEEETEIDDKNMRNTLFFVESADDGRQYIVLNMLNTKNYILDVLLIPSNAQVSVGRDVLSDIQKEMPEAKNTVSLSTISRSFGDKKYEIISKALENVMGITMSGYDVMTEEDFIKFLNMAGDVEYQLDYTISYRDDKGALQVLEAGAADDEESESWENDSTAAADNIIRLDGRKAVELLTYLDGTETQESARLERTSTYLQSFFTGLFEKNKASVIYKKYTNLAQFSEDRNLSDEERIIEQLDADSITIRILQGSESNGIFTVDSQKAKLQVAALAKQASEASGSGKTAADKDDEDETTSSSTAADSKDYSIELYNAAYVAGLAGEWEVRLEEEGYNITLVDSYQEEGPLSTTRIIVSEEGMGEDLLEYFPDASIEVDEIDTGGDIQVYIGTDSTDVGGGTAADYSGDDTTEEEDESNDGETDDGNSSEDDEDITSGGSYSFDTDSE